MKVYWYAPFDNATEIELAESVAGYVDELVFHSVTGRFGTPLPTDHERLELVRDLPPPANEIYTHPTPIHRAAVALRRAHLRQRVTRRCAPDIVHLHTFNMFTDWAALRCLRRHGRPLVLSIHNVRPHERRGPHRLETLLHRIAYGVPDRIIVAHEQLARRVEDEFGVPRDRISIVPLPSPTVDPAEAEPARDPQELLFFGTLRKNKGIDVLLDAIALLPPERPVRIRFAGRGDADLERTVLQHAAADARIEAEIGWIPPERQAELYRRAWAVVVPYLPAFAAQSGTVRVAYSFGTPVIASDTGALGETIRQDGSGWLATPGRARELADTIQRVLDDEAGRHQRAAVAQRLGQERRADRLAPLVRQIYQELLEPS